MRLPRIFLGLALALPTVANAFEAVVELQNDFVRAEEGARRYAKMTIPDADPSELYLKECQKDGSDLAPGAAAFDFPKPLLRGEVPKKIHRLFKERDLPWAVPGDGGGGLGRRSRGSSVKRAYFNPEGVGRLWFCFDKEWKQLRKVTPMGFRTLGGFTTDLAVKPTGLEVLSFSPMEGFIASSDHDLLTNQIQPFDEVAEVASIRETSRRFVARVTATGDPEKYERITVSVPVREVTAPRDGKVFVVLETELRAALVKLAGSGNVAPPQVDMRNIPPELRGQAQALLATVSPEWRGGPHDPIPKVEVALLALPERDLELVDAAKHEKAVEKFELTARYVEPGTITSPPHGAEWTFESEGFAGGPTAELKTVAMKAYVAGHFVTAHMVDVAQVDFATLLRLGLVHGDRMQDCVVELTKHEPGRKPEGEGSN